jgi:hypothetical protein
MNTKLSALKETMNFESTAFTVYTRLIQGKGPGLFVVWGGEPNGPKTNKTYFLNAVESFQTGAKAAKPFVPDFLWNLLEQLEPSFYQCIDVIKDCPVQHHGNIYQTPLSIALPMAVATAACRRGLEAGRKIVILCDNIEQFMEHNRQANEQFLRELARSLDNQTKITFLGASQLTWDAKGVLGSDYALPLGWD